MSRMADARPMVSARVRKDIPQRLRDAAYWDRVSVQDIVEAALLRELSRREKRQQRAK